MTVRRATFADAAQIAHVHVETWRAAYRGLIPDAVLDAIDVERRARFWEERLSSPTSRALFVAEIAGSIAGFVDLIPSRDRDVDAKTVAEIAAFYVLPEHWRKGIGRALCVRALEEARRLRCPTITLWVLVSNLRAHGFYKTMGLALDGCEKAEKMSDGTTLKEVRFRIAF